MCKIGSEADLCSASPFTVVRLRISPTHALLLLPCADVVFLFEKKDSFRTSQSVIFNIII